MDNVTITIEQLDVMDFLVTLTDSSESTQHTVLVTERDHETYAPRASMEDLVAETFRFLLEREPRSMVHQHFKLEDVARLFPDYHFEMTRRFAA